MGGVGGCRCRCGAGLSGGSGALLPCSGGCATPGRLRSPCDSSLGNKQGQWSATQHCGRRHPRRPAALAVGKQQTGEVHLILNSSIPAGPERLTAAEATLARNGWTRENCKYLLLTHRGIAGTLEYANLLEQYRKLGRYGPATASHRRRHRGMAQHRASGVQRAQPPSRTRRNCGRQRTAASHHPSPTNLIFPQVSGPFPVVSGAWPAVREPATGPRRTPSPHRTVSLPSSPAAPARSPPAFARSSSRT